MKRKPSPAVEAFHHAATGALSYLVFDPQSRRAAIIDPVLDFDRRSGRIWAESADAIVSRIRELGLTADWTLETHAHIDHLSAMAYLKDRLGCRIGIGAGICAVQSLAARLFNYADEFPTDGSQFDRLWRGNEEFPIGDLVCRVIETPGHTQDSITYLIGNAAFVGDTLLAPDLGTDRCDSAMGNSRELFISVQRLYELPETTWLMAGHDFPTAGRNLCHSTTVFEQKHANVHANSTVSIDQFSATRDARDRMLPPPDLYHFALQVNARAGRLPPPQSNGVRYLHTPVHSSSVHGWSEEARRAVTEMLPELLRIKAPSAARQD